MRPAVVPYLSPRSPSSHTAPFNNCQDALLVLWPQMGPSGNDLGEIFIWSILDLELHTTCTGWV